MRRGISSRIVTAKGNEHDDPSSNIGRDICISHSTDMIGKGTNPIIYSPTMGKL